MPDYELKLESNGTASVVKSFDNIDQADAKLAELSDIIQPFTVESIVKKNKEDKYGVPLAVEDESLRYKAVGRRPSFYETEQLGCLVAKGLTLEQAASIMTPPFKYPNVLRHIQKSPKLTLIYKRSQAAWILGAIQCLLTIPNGLMFILKNRHSRMFGASTTKIDVTTNGEALSLTSPEVIERAKAWAEKHKDAVDIDGETMPLKQIESYEETKSERTATQT